MQTLQKLIPMFFDNRRKAARVEGEAGKLNLSERGKFPLIFDGWEKNYGKP